MKTSSSPSKSTAKKTTVKKVAKKVTATKKPVAKKATEGKKVPLVCAPQAEQFWMSDGQILADLVALADSFAAMDELLFSFHANKERNDFADWVEAVLGDKTCANSLRKADSPKKAHGVVVRRLRSYHV